MNSDTQLTTLLEEGINSLCCLCFEKEDDTLYSLESLLDERKISSVLEDIFEFVR